MASPARLRDDYSGDELRRLARESGDAKQVRRLLALAAIRDGQSRSEAARIGGVGAADRARLGGALQRRGTGGADRSQGAGQAADARAGGARGARPGSRGGAKPYLDGVVRWRLIDLVQWLWDNFGVSVSETTVGRELRAMGFRKLTPRPRHYAQDPEALEAFKKTFPPAWRRSRGPRRAASQ